MKVASRTVLKKSFQVMDSRSGILLLVGFLLLVPSQAVALPFLHKASDKKQITGSSLILACTVNKFKESKLNIDLPQFTAHGSGELSSSLQDLVSSQNICVLENELATGQEIMAKLEDDWLARKSGPNDRVFILLSLPCFPSDRKKEVFLLPYDTDPNNLEKSALRLEQILEAINKIKAKSIVLAIEAPFNGAIEALGADDCWFGTYNLVVDEKLALNIEKTKNLTLLLSSDNTKPTISGAFFNNFAQELRNLPVSMSLSSLFERVKTKTMESTKLNCKVCKGQIPVLYGKTGAKSIYLGPSCLIPSSSK